MGRNDLGNSEYDLKVRSVLGPRRAALIHLPALVKINCVPFAIRMPRGTLRPAEEADVALQVKLCPSSIPISFTIHVPE